MVLGTTGAGKSTLIHQLVDRKVVAEYPQNETSLKLFVRKEDQIGEAFAIGHGVTSCTTNPNAYHDKQNNIIWWDCPGFLDTKGIIQDLCNQIAVSELFTGKKPSKILLVASEAKFRDDRGSPVWKAVDSIVTMFKDPNANDDKTILEYLKNSLVFVVTHAPNDFNIKRELLNLSQEPPNNATDIARGLMKNFMLNVGQKCFTSFSPSKKGVFELGERNNILNELVKPGSNLIARQAFVDQKSKECAQSVTNQIRKEIGFNIDTYINSITSKTTNETPMSTLSSFIEFFDKIPEIVKTSVNDSEFLEKLLIDGKSLSGLDVLIKNIKNISEVHTFLMKFGVTPLNIGDVWEIRSYQVNELFKGKKINIEYMSELRKTYEKERKENEKNIENVLKKIEEEKGPFECFGRSIDYLGIGLKKLILDVPQNSFQKDTGTNSDENQNEICRIQ